MAAAATSRLNEYRHYCAAFTREQVVERMEQLLQRTGNESYETGESERALWRDVCARIRARTALSVVRLGDGEGNLQFWGAHAARYPQLASWSRDQIWHMMFGRPARDEEARDTLDKMRDSVESADFLGIPWREDIRTAAVDDGEPELADWILRGYCGYLSIWETLARERRLQAGVRVGTRRLHEAFLEIARELLSAAANVSLITCYPNLLDAVEEAFDVRGIETLQIPPQGESAGNDDWPLRVSERLRERNLEERLFLVGAGIVGKGFCEDIKQSGGMAIDIGSMLDVWSGHSARPYQTEEYVRRYALI